jgi:hypothetical protein
VLTKKENTERRGGNADLVAEVRSLREDINGIGLALLKRVNKTGRTVDGFIVDGTPAVRVAVQ